MNIATMWMFHINLGELYCKLRVNQYQFLIAVKVSLTDWLSDVEEEKYKHERSLEICYPHRLVFCNDQ